MTKVVILAGGLGTRLSEYTKEIPKPMIKINGIPILKRIMNHYSKFGFIDGFIVITVASNLKILIHYNLGKLLRNKKISFLNLGNKIARAQKNTSQLKQKIFC